MSRGYSSKPVGRSSAVVAAAVALALSQAAQAQDSPRSSVLEEVVVTAERRDVSLQDVPASATVLTAETLAAQGVDNVLDIQQVAPSVAINTYNRSTFVNIRGVGIAQSAPTSNPGVAYYIDGMFIPHEQFIANSFYDIETIEVLRGPQGTLTGQNSTGGAIYVRTPVPDATEFSGYIDQTIADYDWYRTVAAVNVPVTDTLAIRLSGVYDDRGSFSENIGPSPSEPGRGEDRSVRAAIRWQPTDGATFDVRYEWFERETDYNAVKNRNDLVTSDPFVIQEDAISFLTQDGYRASLEGRFDVSDAMQLRVLTSYLDAENEDQADGDRSASALPVPLPLPTTGANTARFPGRVGYTSQGLETWVSEVNLLSSGESDLQWVVGGFYMEEESPTQVLRDNRNVVTLVQSNSTIDTVLNNESISAFGQVDYRLTDSWAIDIGARYSEDEQTYQRNMVPGPPPPGGFPSTSVATSNETTGRVGLKFFASDDVMMYGTVSRGYKAGGVNLDPRSANYGPETNEQIELGVKSTVADGRMRLNGAAFYSEYEGIQLSALTGGVPNTKNGPKAEIMGLELELTGQFGGLGVNFGGSWLAKAEFVEQGFDITNPATQLVEVLEVGDPVPLAPELTLNAGVQYEFLIGEMTLTPRLQVSYTDEQWAAPFEPNPNLRVPSRTITDARITFSPIQNLRIEAFATNLFDKEYIAVQLQDASSAQGGYIYGPPRQYGVRAKYDF